MRTSLRVLSALLLASLAITSPAQGRKDSVVLGMVLEPSPGLDPTAASAAAIGEVVHLNVLEGLTKIGMDGKVSALLAESWSVDPDGKLYTFKLKRGVRFHDGEAFDASDVKFSFERARAEGSTNKAKKAVFDNISRIDTPDPHTVILVLNNADGNFLFRMGENTAVILDPKSAATTATKPVGTGPFKLEDWKKGSSITLVKNADYRGAAAVKMKKVTFRFINDPAAQVAALLAGDIDGMPRFGAPQNLKQFQSDKRFTVEIGGTEGKTIVSINNRKKPFDDVRVRRAIAAAIDRKAIIDGAMEGYGAPIGSHLVPSDAGYVDLTAVNPYNPEKAKALLKEAGVATPLNVTLTLPPPQYARKGGEIVAAQLAKVGIVAKIENVEWAQWLSGAFKGNYDLTIISHVEPLDFDRYADPAYYWGYESKAYKELLAKYNTSTDAKTRLKLIGDIQKLLATDAVNAYLFQLPQFAVARKPLKGLWSSSPIFANDLAALSW
ncbi:ABC transporter substrate-binding protein [Piscinibacter sp.]|jgi:peptide/nickel transport system substrate-binding protein|uniref:ABC transporter substrate-binding protein n=1 Tax=Piscinibacter sp. TaxID=1903157 RepID=UPI001B6E68EF|nr:ABC transporter substrate-binding protein [Piscinibacter sp.]MBK7532113.1 ABC transporter substrate-binding protein [Piscinibacter sp.]MBP6543473.1 ABC transporter substrate-binding protein [Piscinibacter sp.]HPG80939.1 ABC transporter substrate-binding protein [Piscinibacter sp.]